MKMVSRRGLITRAPLVLCAPSIIRLARAQGGMGPGPGTVHSAAGGGSFTAGPHAVAAGQNGGTTSAIDTTGMKLIVISASQYTGAGVKQPPTDSKSNTWTPLTAQAGFVENYVRLFYCLNPTTDAAHTFTVAASGIFGSFQVETFSTTGAGPTFDKESGAAATGPANASLACGSVTPTNVSSVIVTGMSTNYNTGASTVTAGYTITDQSNFSTGNFEGGAIAYLIETSIAATNPTWTPPGLATDIAVACAVFAP